MNKNITDISYSWNNLPNHILLAQDNQNTIDYLYNAAGTKLRKVTSSDQAAGLTTDYSGPFVYEDSKLAFIQTSEGRVVPDQDAYAYEYFLKDHLGNTRVVFNDQGEVLQSNSYYPFGGTMEGLNYTAGLAPENKYLYNGKEFQDDFGLDWYDYGARFYDAQLGRFHTLDPLSESYSYQSPFAYAANNPIRFMDWMGMRPGDPPPGTTQLYVKLTGSFGPQLGFSIGDMLSASIKGANVEGETKIGVNISPEGKINMLFEQESKNIDYQLKGTTPVSGKSVTQEYETDEDPSMATVRSETQKGFVKETQNENYEGKNTTESTSYEVGVGANAVLLGLEINIGFEFIESSKTEEKPIENKQSKMPEEEQSSF